MESPLSHIPHGIFFYPAQPFQYEANQQTDCSDNQSVNNHQSYSLQHNFDKDDCNA